MSNHHISSKAQIGKNVHIGSYTVIHDNVEIGDNTIIENHCEIGYPSPLAEGRPLCIGPDSHIRTHSLFYEGSSFGPELLTGHGVQVREHTHAGINFRIGSLNDIQGDCVVGCYVRTHSNVHICKGSCIGDLVWLFPYVILTNDPLPPSEMEKGPTIKNMAVIATRSMIYPGVTIGKGSFVGAFSQVKRDVPDGTGVAGNPAVKIPGMKRLFKKYKINYPWATHFRRGYPEESYALMEEMISKLQHFEI